MALYLVFLAGLVAFAVYSFDRQMQVAITIALAASYTTWGVIHHMIHEDLRWIVFLEYLSVSALGVVVILSLLINT